LAEEGLGELRSQCPERSLTTLKTRRFLALEQRSLSQTRLWRKKSDRNVLSDRQKSSIANRFWRKERSLTSSKIEAIANHLQLLTTLKTAIAMSRAIANHLQSLTTLKQGHR
jgi:hypothetical protein